MLHGLVMAGFLIVGGGVMQLEQQSQHNTGRRGARAMKSRALFK